MKKAIETIRIAVLDTNDRIMEKNMKTNDAYGRIIAKDVYSPINVPSCKTSARHGYAVLTSDGKDVRKVLKAQVTVRIAKI